MRGRKLDFVEHATIVGQRCIGFGAARDIAEDGWRQQTARGRFQILQRKDLVHGPRRA